MPRRVRLPGADELFRPTQPDQGAAPAPAAVPPATAAPRKVEPSRTDAPTPTGGSGRVRHDEKITVYVSAEELVALERARLTLRAEHGMAVDRGRMVRVAVAAAVADLAENGAASTLVTRLSTP